MSNSLKPVLASKGNDAEIAARFKELYQGSQNGLRRVVAFGIFAWQVKLYHLKHGQFIPWCQQHCPDLSRSSIHSHMQLSESALKHAGVKSLKSLISNVQTLDISHSGDFLLLPDAKVPETLKPLREKVFSIIDGKSARQMFMEFKQSEDDDDGNAKPKRGRLKGQGGASKEQRAAAALAEEKARVAEIEISAREFGKWMDDVSDAKGIGCISDKAFNAYFEKLESHRAFVLELYKARKKGGAQ